MTVGVETDRDHSLHCTTQRDRRLARRTRSSAMPLQTRWRKNGTASRPATTVSQWSVRAISMMWFAVRSHSPARRAGFRVLFRPAGAATEALLISGGNACGASAGAQL